MSHSIQSIQLQPAYILHTRSYRDTSLLLDLFTLEYGRISAIARGAKGARSRFKGLLQPFVPLLISWYGKSELVNLAGAESNGWAAGLNGEALMCGLYLNELLVRLLHRHDAHPELYNAYQQALVALSNGDAAQPLLRLFEKRLLLQLGYALRLDCDASSGEKINSEQFYYFEPTHGLTMCRDTLKLPKYNLFSGHSLLALHENTLTKNEFLRDAKRLLRLALGHLLEGKPLRSRELFLR